MADPRLTCSPRSTVYGVRDWLQASGAVIGSASHDNGAWSVADPRVTCDRREGSLGVRGWADASAPVIGHATHHNWPAGVSDPRTVSATHVLRAGDPPTLIGDQLDFTSRKPMYVIIRALDGSWHRPMTTLELAALQGFPTTIDGQPLVLDGGSHAGWRQRIGNAVPPPAAEAIARQMMKTLQASRDGGFLMSSTPTWVTPHQPTR